MNMRLPSRVDAGDLKLDTHPAVLHGTASPTRDGAVFRVSDVPAAEGFGVLAQFPSGVIHAQPPSWQEEADREERLQNRRVLLRLADLVLSRQVPAAVGTGSRCATGVVVHLSPEQTRVFYARTAQ